MEVVLTKYVWEFRHYSITKSRGFLFHGLYRLFQWVILVILARWASPQFIGMVVLVWAVTKCCFSFSFFQTVFSKERSSQAAWQGVARDALRSLLLLTPLFYLAFHSGVNQVGFYGVIAPWLLWTNYFLDPTQSPWAKVWKQFWQAGGSEGLYRSFLKTLGLSFLGGVAIIWLVGLWGSGFLQLVYGDEYSKYGDIFVALCGAGMLFFLNFLCRLGLTLICDRNVSLGFLIFWVAFQNFISFWMVLAFGIAGAAWSLVLIGLLMFLVHIILLERAAASTTSKKT